jgi:hypothetical protein
MQDPVLRALVPGITDQESKEFFEFRDSPDQDNLFKDEEDFFRYLTNNIGRFRGDSADVKRFREGLRRRGIRIVIDESAFKIIVNASVGRARRTLEAWVTLTGARGDGTGAGRPAGGPNAIPGLEQLNAGGLGIPSATPNSKPDVGLKITFMRVS